MKSLFIALACIYATAMFISGNPIVKRSPFLCDGKADGNYPNPNNCEQFYTCSNGMASITTCPADLHYNNNTDQCDFPSNVNCNPLDNFCSEKPSSGNYAHPSDCTKFLACGQDLSRPPTELACPDNLHFNQTADQCQQPNDAGCQL